MEDTVESLKEELRRIEEWEEDQRDLWFWERLGRLPFALLDRMMPKAVHDRIGQLLDELGNYIQTGGQYLIDEAPVMRRLAETAGRPGAFLTPEKAADLPLACLNRASEEIKASHVRFARYQGAVTGLGGLFTLAADIPLLLGTSLKVIQEMALVYGYDPRIPSERAFAVYCLQFSSSDIVGKRAILSRLSSWETGERMRESVSLLEGWREVIMNYGDQWGWKKLFQMVPVAGAIFGAWINQSAVEEVAEAARMMYRKRRVLAKLEKMEGASRPEGPR
ncbi:MAG: EcsC family protein [Planifilum fulgidum]|nr:EcsC family protein [Planifilum fulgidum]MBO2497670.1 EcsC family protein [Bacillota bacterium]MBO2532976.1 EcsC family protein [Thermoactinomycetaceae bacterium]